jgi:glucose-6-phosphate isomerase
MDSIDFDPADTPAWSRLSALAASHGNDSISDYFRDDPERPERYSLRVGELYLDYSKNRVSDAIFSALMDLAEQSPLSSRREALFAGDIVNPSESRPALHTALRHPQGAKPEIRDAIRAEQEKLRFYSEGVRDGSWRGATGKAFTDVVHIGIGGSELGPRLACQALREFRTPGITLHFLANVDGAEVNTLLARLNPETSLVIVASKTFTTRETRLNTDTVMSWLARGLDRDDPQATSHVLGVTAGAPEALAFGIPEKQILGFWDWVGGRYSLWSAVGLPVAIAIGYEPFSQMLSGAAHMDAHFRTAPHEHNMPVILALLGLWYSNFLGAPSHCVVPYCERLGLLPAYLQQLDMESNGKAVTLDEHVTGYRTGPIVWGQTGTSAQHAFFQLLHQGTHLVPVDMIAAVRDNLSSRRHHRVLLGNMLAQAAVLMAGNNSAELPAHRRYPGNRPSNTLLLDTLSPANLGALLALYEHKVFTQASLWNINPFDQWGVELGKKLAAQLMDDGEQSLAGLDPSTRDLLDHLEL